MFPKAALFIVRDLPKGQPEKGEQCVDIIE
jgi:hypothetical protein